ncbi:hypothetical protein [Nocardia sp. NPDC049707]|uniref:hypothetical protein n=1 Tax=Nocardia sp. NPDC049707 TaxID=3154735 RepID=UPI0034219758
MPETDPTATVAQSTDGSGVVSIEELIKQGVPPEEVEPGYAVSEAEAQRISAERLAEARRLEDEQIAELPLSDQEEIRQVQRELAALGVEVHAVTKWWGFEIHLNAEAAQVAATITEQVGKVLAKIPKLKPFSPLIKAYCKAKAKWIKEVGKTYGCKLVSPWIAPGMLIPISLRPADDTSLWWTVYGRDADTGQYKWSEDTKFAAHKSKSNPALAVYKDKLYCVHRGDYDDKLWWTVYDTTAADADDPNSGWSEDTYLGAHTSGAGPALAVYNDTLHCVHRGGGSQTQLWWTTFDGKKWSDDVQIGGRTSHGPGLAVHDGKLFCAYKGYNNNQLYWRTLTDKGWSGEDTLPGKTNSNPALASYKNTLYAMYTAYNSSVLYVNRFSGDRWQGDYSLPNHKSTEGPALAVYNNELYCVHRGATNDKKLWWARTSNGTSWTQDSALPAHTSAQGPAIIAYRDLNGTQDQLMCVHRGY